ncbi:unnamed protein product [Diamesa serratosioi]
MRYNNQLNVDKMAMNHLSKSAKVTCAIVSGNYDSSSVISGSLESMSDMGTRYQWNVNGKSIKTDQGLPKVNSKSFTVLCHEGEEGEVINNNEPIKQAPTSRQPVSICVLNCRYDCIVRVAKALSYKIVRPNNLMLNKTSLFEFNYENKYSSQNRQGKQEHDMWNLCWTDSVVAVDFCRDMRRFQKINHFPGMFEICRKDLLARNLNRMLRLFPDEYNIFPKTWCFPADLGDAIQFSRQHKNKTYILKPDQGSQGRGIWLTKNLKDVKTNERMICQLYLSKPLLIDGFKFDLRVYTLITSTDPLRVFVYNEGLARFATSKYREPSDYNTNNMFMHLTNYSVNKHSRMYSTDDELGTKRKISTLNRILATEGFDVAELWSNIDDVIIKTILSALPMLKHNYNASFPSHDMVQACFEILGMDIMIDSKMKPFILEVNHSPSFHTSEQVDKEVKEALIRDTFLLLNLSQDIRKKVLDEDRRRIRDRLLQRIKDTKDANNNNNNATEDVSADQQPEVYLDKQHNWEQQIAWEDTHLGGFRKVMPTSNEKNSYKQFYVQQNQLSVYSETAASKRREECAKQQRIDLEEKTKQNQQLLQQFRHNKQLNGEDDIIRKKKVKKDKRNFYKADDIGENDERDRCTSLAQREYLIKSCGLLQSIYVHFHRNQLLTESDKRKYKDVFSKLTITETTMTLPVLSSIQAKTKVMKSFMSAQPTNVPTNLTVSMVQQDISTLSTKTTTTNSSSTKSSENTTTLSSFIPNEFTPNNSSWMYCPELPITARPQLPSLPHQASQIKPSLTRQVTSVVKRHNYRQQFHTDKII